MATLHTTITHNLTHNLGLRSRERPPLGQALIQDATTKIWNRPKKSTDLIDLENVVSLAVTWPVDPYLAQRVETQFYDGSNPNKKLTLSPFKLTESIGLTRKFYENDKDLVVSRLGLGIRQIISKTITDTITLAVEKSTAYDGGIESVSEVDLAVHKNIRYNGKL